MTLRVRIPDAHTYNSDYKTRMFQWWYNNGKPKPTVVSRSFNESDPFLGSKPSSKIIRKWIDDEWMEIAEQMDSQVKATIQESMIAEKVQVLQRHADVGKKMQDLALAYLDEHGVGSSRNAIELLVKGLEIERLSVGAPKVAARLMDMTEEQLLEELKELVSGSPIVSIEPSEVFDDAG